MAILSLEEYVSIDVLEDIVNKFYSATHLVTNFSDYQGRPITKEHNFCRLCTAIHKSDEFYPRCIQCDAIGGMQASLSKKPYLHICHAGLCDAAIPIIVNNTYLGMVLTGQVRLKDIPADMPSMKQTYSYPNSLFESEEQYQKLYDEAPVLSYQEMLANIDLLNLIANYVANIGHSKIAQEQYLKDKIATAKEEQIHVELQNSLTKLELQTAFSKLNPKFLLETFNTIYQQAVIEDASETADLILSLNTLISRTIDHPDITTSLEEEMRYIFNMISLRNISRYNTIHFQTYIDSNTQQAQVPVSILQSLIENCYLEQIEQQDMECDINLRAALSGDHLVIQLSCPQIALPVVDFTLENESEHFENWTRTAYQCICNIRKSLSLCYKNHYQFKTCSMDNGCDEFYFSLPLKLELEEKYE